MRTVSRGFRWVVLGLLLAGCAGASPTAPAPTQGEAGENPTPTGVPAAPQPIPVGTGEPAAVEMGAVEFVCFSEYDEYTYTSVNTPGLRIEIRQVSGPSAGHLDLASAQVAIQGPQGDTAHHQLQIQAQFGGGFGGVLEIREPRLVPGDYHWTLEAITYADGGAGVLEQPAGGTLTVTEQQIQAQCLDG